MARKLRIQYEGAWYRVINRGNYRRDVFGTVGAAQAFEEACRRRANCTGGGWHRKVARDHAQRALRPGLEAGELKEMKETHWHHVLQSELQQAGRKSKEIAQHPGNAPWKIILAIKLRQAGASCAWITAAWSMGKTSSVRAYLSRAK